MAILHRYGSKIEISGFAAQYRDKPKPVLKWTLADMIAGAIPDGLAPTNLQAGAAWDARKAKIGDVAEQLKQLRNLVHPARYLLDQSPHRVTRRHLLDSLEIFEASTQYLNAIVLESLTRRMRRDVRMARRSAADS